jgi:tetratricopeptide (TPR) repeat protein
MAINVYLKTYKLEVLMKTFKKCLYVVLTLVFILPAELFAQVKEVPVTTSSKDALSLFLAGRDKFENLELSAASTLFDQAIQKDPDFALAYLYRSQSGGGYNVYRQNLEKAVALSEKVSEGEKMEIAYAKTSVDGNGQKQKESLDQLLSAFPGDKRVQSLAGEYYYTINDFQNALSHFKKSTEIDVNYAPVYNMIGYCQSALNNFPEAEKAFQSYIRLVPKNPNPYDSYAELLLKMGKYDESIAQYRKALEKDQQFATSLAGIGNNYVFKGDFEQARKYYQEYSDKSVSVNGKLDALFLKAVTYVHEGNKEQAVATFDQYRALAEKENLPTNSINSYAYQGFTATESGDPVSGMKYFDKATDLIGKSELSQSTKENLMTNSMLWRFYSLTANNDLDKAQAEYEKCKERIESRKNPNEVMFLNSLLGLLEIKKGDYDNAIKYFSQADTQDPWTWYFTAVAYEKKGDSQNSEKILDRITKYNVNSLNLAFVRNHAKEDLKSIMSESSAASAK